MTIGDNIKKYRKQNKISQAKLSELIGKSKSSIEKYEANKITPSISVLNDIASALNITINDLTNQNKHGLQAHVKSKQALNGYTYKPVNNDIIQLDANNPNHMDMLINSYASNMSYDELITHKNKMDYSKELDNQIPLRDKLDSKQLELLYISKLNDLKNIIETQERMIKQLEEMNNLRDKRIEQLSKLNDKLFSLLGGGTDGE